MSNYNSPTGKFAKFSLNKSEADILKSNPDDTLAIPTDAEAVYIGKRKVACITPPTTRPAMKLRYVCTLDDLPRCAHQLPQDDSRCALRKYARRIESEYELETTGWVCEADHHIYMWAHGKGDTLEGLYKDLGAFGSEGSDTWVEEIRKCLQKTGEAIALKDEAGDGGILMITPDGLRIQSKKVTINGKTWDDLLKDIADDAQELTGVKSSFADLRKCVQKTGDAIALKDEAGQGGILMITPDGIRIQSKKLTINGKNWDEFYNSISARLSELEKEKVHKEFHALIDYPFTTAIEIKGGKAYCTARYAANSYEGAPATSIFKATCLCYAYDDSGDYDFVASAVNFYTDTSLTTRIRPAADGTIELAQGVSVVAVFEVPLTDKALGRRIAFKAQDAYSNHEGELKSTLTALQFYVEEESIPKARPLNTNLHLHSLGGNISVNGKEFGSDYRYALKAYIDGVTTSGSGNISNQPLPSPDAIINVRATEYKPGDLLRIQIGQTIVEVPSE